jgi:YopX protein
MEEGDPIRGDGEKMSRRKWTGLLDLKGKKICDGDVIEYPTYDRPHGRKSRVKMERARVCWRKASQKFSSPEKWDTEVIEGFEGYRAVYWSSFRNATVVKE